MMKKQRADRDSVVAVTHEFACGKPEFSQIENQDAFMVRAAFPTYEEAIIPDNYFKLGLVLAGEGTLNFNTRYGSSTSTFRQGQISATMPMLTGDTFSSPMDMLGLCIDLNKFESCSIGGIQTGVLEEASQSLIDDPMIQSVMIALWQTSRGSDFSSLFFREGIELILNRIARVASRHEHYAMPDKTNKAKLQRVNGFILDNLTEQISVADMALEAGLSESQFFNLCKQVTGMTPFAYLTHCRLQQAKQLLTDGGSVIETSLAVGYANPSKFAAAFRRHEGHTPVQWRKLNAHNM